MHRETIGKTPFTFRLVQSAVTIDEVYRLRYSVYGDECHFIRKEDYPDGRETDHFDPHAIHFVAEDPKGVVGAARLILDSPRGFPIEEHCSGSLSLGVVSAPRSSIAEVSRLVFSKTYRRRAKDELYYEPEFNESVPGHLAAGISRRIRPMAFGLYREMYQESKRRGITHWYALMEDSLCRLLKIHGFEFKVIGPEIDFYGRVKPYLGTIEDIERLVMEKFPVFFETYFLDGLEPQFRPSWSRAAVEPGARGIYEMVRAIADAMPQTPAVSWEAGGERSHLSYGTLLREAVRWGEYIKARGVNESDRVVLMLGNQPEWPIAFLAIQYAKAVAVPLDPALPADDIAGLIFHCNARMVISQNRFAPRLAAFVGGGVGKTEILLFDNPETAKRINNATDVPSSSRIDADPARAAAFFYTSGTTSGAKAVMLSHRNLISNALAIVKVGISRPGDIFISFLPLYHTYSFLTTCLIPLITGSLISYPSGLSSNELLTCIRETKVNIVVGVPTFFNFFHRRVCEELAARGRVGRFIASALIETLWALRKMTGLNLAPLFLRRLHRQFGRLRFMVSGGARLDPKVALDLFKWGFTILEGYGLTETSPAATWNPPGAPRIGSVGKPLPGVEVKVFGPDERGIGEVGIKGPNVMMGYFQYPGADGAARIKDGWFMTGDAGSIDRDGYLSLVGRKDELIVLSSGKKVNPEEIEDKYSSSPLIKEICVFPTPGERFSGAAEVRLFAVIVPNVDAAAGTGSGVFDEGRLREELDRLSRLVASHNRINGFAVSFDPLERTSLGKLKRNRIEAKCVTRSFQTSAPDVRGPERDDELYADETVRKVLEHLSLKLGRDVRPSHHLEYDLGFDSLGRMELLLDIEKLLGSKVDESTASRAFQARTIRELLQVITGAADGQARKIKS